MKIAARESQWAGWIEANQRYLTAALAEIRQRLLSHIEPAQEENIDDNFVSDPGADDFEGRPPALQTLVEIFGLSRFERDILLLCAGMELESGFDQLCALAGGNTTRPFPTFSLALTVFEEGHWSALVPYGPLRRWRLIDLEDNHPGVSFGSLTRSQLRVTERILHYLVGLQQPEERLAGVVEAAPFGPPLAPSQQALAQQLAAVWQRTPEAQPPPIFQLTGPDSQALRGVAQAACRAVGVNLSLLPARYVPDSPAELFELIHLWQRESVLSASALLIEFGEETADHSHRAAVYQFAGRSTGAIFLAGAERQPVTGRPTVIFEVNKPTAGEQEALWRAALNGTGAEWNGQIEKLVAQFNLSTPAIQSASLEAIGRWQQSKESDDIGQDGIGRTLWDVCRVQARPRLDDLAQPILPVAHWDDIILPEGQRLILDEIAAHVRQRHTVYRLWAFEAEKGGRGLGISALFSGASGTGKTMAAEVLANELRLDLYRIDLSQVVSKYIGETEKNLRRIFDAAEEGGAILLFDEADALFGKRSEVKDSHDRYANIEISYLLQRMELYRGLAILTTNMKESLDDAFLRRLRFVVQFPFPDAAQRAKIWQGIFPSKTPTRDLNYQKLARMNITGGNIRNIALYAAMLAADAGEAVTMSHLRLAARREYAKLERPLTDAETAGW